MVSWFGPRRGPWTHQGILEIVGFLWQERAAIAEFDGGLSREDAEQLGWQEVNAFLAAIGGDPGKSPACTGATCHWRPPPPSYYGDVTLPPPGSDP